MNTDFFCIIIIVIFRVNKNLTKTWAFYFLISLFDM